MSRWCPAYGVEGPTDPIEAEKLVRTRDAREAYATTRRPASQRPASQRLRSSAAVAVSLLLMLGVGCAPETSSGEGNGAGESGRPQVGGPDVEIDTPQLREAKAAAGVEDCVPGTAQPVDGGLPDVELPCFGGGEVVNLSTLAGPLVINLWASWCGPCREEMPVFAQFHDTYGDTVPVLGIDINDSSPNAAMELVDESGVTYPSLADTEPILTRTEEFLVASRGLPVTMIVDEDGRIAYSQAIAFDDLDELVDVVEQHVELPG